MNLAPVNRLTIRQEWKGKGVVLKFPVDGKTVEMQHDMLVEIIRVSGRPYLKSPSWPVDGRYSIDPHHHTLRNILSAFALD